MSAEHCPCPGCHSVTVPAGDVCFDCTFRTPQERQREAELLRECLVAARRDLRDRFAMAALPALTVGGLPSVEAVAQWAYQYADAMMRARQPKPSGP